MKRRQFIQLATVTSLATIANNAVATSPNLEPQADLVETTISELQAKMQSHELSAKEITAKYLARIKEIDGKTNSIIEQNPDALKIAESLDAERKSGKVRSPLH